MPSSEKKQKILYIITQPEWGGAQRYVYDIAAALRGEFDIVVATGRNGETEKLLNLLSRLQTRNVRTHQFRHLVREINPWHDILAIFEIAKFIKKEKPDLVHLNSSKAGVLGAISCCLRSTRLSKRNVAKIVDVSLRQSISPRQPRVFYTVHGWTFLEPLPFWKKKLYLLMEKLSGKLRTGTIILSGTERNAALENKICRPNQIHLIPHGIDLENNYFLDQTTARHQILQIQTGANPARANADDYIESQDSTGCRSVCRSETSTRLSTFRFDSRHGQNIWIGSIANLYPTKGLEYLIEAAAMLCRNPELQTPNLLFIIIGEGKERPRLETLIQKHNLQNSFLLIGSLPEAAKYLKAFDVFVLPSVKEGFPYVLLEAMSAGVPIVAAKVGGVPEMLDNRHSPLKNSQKFLTGQAPVVERSSLRGTAGLLVSPGNPKELAKSIQKLIIDKELGLQLSVNAAERVKERYRLEKMLEKTKKVYSYI